MPVILQGHRPARYPCASILRCASPQGRRCALSPVLVTPHGSRRAALPARTSLQAQAHPRARRLAPLLLESHQTTVRGGEANSAALVAANRKPHLVQAGAAHVGTKEGGGPHASRHISPHVKLRTYGARRTYLHAHESSHARRCGFIPVRISLPRAALPAGAADHTGCLAVSRREGGSARTTTSAPHVDASRSTHGVPTCTSSRAALRKDIPAGPSSHAHPRRDTAAHISPGS
ncbi:hypothetical protein K438DRAFT_1993296 [Mycena galopus ATCC 62051]|nr:hypothetical protein K438DRAFT_1993296 [Mycena galopus ATCC 62051]